MTPDSHLLQTAPSQDVLSVNFCFQRLSDKVFRAFNKVTKFRKLQKQNQSLDVTKSRQGHGVPSGLCLGLYQSLFGFVGPSVLWDEVQLSPSFTSNFERGHRPVIVNLEMHSEGEEDPGSRGH